MSVKCAWASIDERGKASGGKAGDQTGKEVKTGDYYNFGQTVVYRPKTVALGNKIAAAAVAIAKNPNVGYDQGNRTSLWTAADKADWKIADIKTKCETDCSAMIAVECRVAGVKISKDVWTGNLGEALMDTGDFKKLDKSYCDDPALLRKGDIVLNPQKHVVTVISNGSKATAKKTTATTTKKSTSNVTKGRVTANSGLNIRKKPSTKASIVKAVPHGTILSCYGTKKAEGMTWWAVNKGKSQWAAAKYIKKV